MDTHMSQVFYASHEFRPHSDRHRHWAGRIWNSFRGAVRAWRRRKALRRAAFELNQLDDRTLRDIGIDRTQIAHAVRRGHFASRPRLSADMERGGGWR